MEGGRYCCCDDYISPKEAEKPELLPCSSGSGKRKEIDSTYGQSRYKKETIRPMAV